MIAEEGREELRLQWGRALASAERAHAGVAVVLCAVASMGPRSRERGELRLPEKRKRRQRRLQWGRALASAERKLMRQTSSPIRALQWGRALASAERRIESAR